MDPPYSWDLQRKPFQRSLNRLGQRLLRPEVCLGLSDLASDQGSGQVQQFVSSRGDFGHGLSLFKVDGLPKAWHLYNDYRADHGKNKASFDPFAPWMKIGRDTGRLMLVWSIPHTLQRVSQSWLCLPRARTQMASPYPPYWICCCSPSGNGRRPGHNA